MWLLSRINRTPDKLLIPCFPASQLATCLEDPNKRLHTGYQQGWAKLSRMVSCLVDRCRNQRGGSWQRTTFTKKELNLWHPHHTKVTMTITTNPSRSPRQSPGNQTPRESLQPAVTSRDNRRRQTLHPITRRHLQENSAVTKKNWANVRLTSFCEKHPCLPESHRRPRLRLPCFLPSVGHTTPSESNHARRNVELRH